MNIKQKAIDLLEAPKQFMEILHGFLVAPDLMTTCIVDNELPLFVLVSDRKVRIVWRDEEGTVGVAFKSR